MDLNLVSWESCYGKIWLASMPKDGHRDAICRQLSRFLKCPVDASMIVQTEDHPRPEFPGLPVDVNWTHSRDLCVVAFSTECRVGVDLEFRRPRRLDLAERFFSPEEWRHLQGTSQSGGDALAEFYRLWCRKEAFFKCNNKTFFGGTLRRNLLIDAVDGICLVDLDPVKLDIREAASLCLAYAPRDPGSV